MSILRSMEASGDTLVMTVVPVGGERLRSTRGFPNEASDGHIRIGESPRIACNWDVR
jgi:hypothetical protein